jgi:hypothetical protein
VRFAFRWVIPFTLIGLFACGGDGGTTLGGLTTPQKLADRLTAEGLCESFSPNTEEEEFFVRDSGSCEKSNPDAEAIYIRTFSSGTARDNWLEVAKSFGGQPLVVGDKWIVEATSDNEARQIQSIVGGDIR